jgi:hypothetical protein
VVTSTGRLAHKPYCEATRARLLRAGSVVLCRGCTMTALGLAVGVAAAAWAWFGPLVALPLLLIGLAGLHAAFFAAMPNPVRDMTRARTTGVLVSGGPSATRDDARRCCCG